MSFDQNSFNCTGRLGSDPEVKPVGDDNVANFRIAVGTGKDSTMWLQAAAWGKQAEAAERFLVKGSRAAFSGRLSQRTYKHRDGYDVTVTEFTVNSITLLDKKGEGPTNDRDHGAREERKPVGAGAGRRSEPAEDDIGLDDIPF